MVRPSNLRRKAMLIAILAMIGTFAGSMIFSGVIGESLSVLNRRPTGNPLT